jgi:hypothetical protein
MPMDDYSDEGEKSAEAEKARSFDEFDCPNCNANNPYGDGFRVGDEIRCFYCGTEYKVKVTDTGKLKLKEI